MNALDPIPFDELPRGAAAPGRGARHIAEVLEDRGVDASADLYDEAVALARDGQLARARDRLRMLLCLDPHDGQAHLLLAKVLAAQTRWADAIAELDNASACGLRLPPGLRDGFEARRDARERDSRAEKVMAATRGELGALRDEAKRLRAENTRLERQVRDLNDKSRLWMSATVVVCVACVLALLGALFASDGGEASVDEPAEVAATELPAEGVVEAAPPELVPHEEPAVAQGPRTYIVVGGDNLSVVSEKVYGTSARWEEIRDANEHVLHGSNALQIGMELTLPD